MAGNYTWFDDTQTPIPENPILQIRSPTDLPTYNIQSDVITLEGVASDNVLILEVTWLNDTGGSGTATGTNNWSVIDIPLILGINNITVTAHDADTNTGADVIAVEYTEVAPPPDTEDPVITIGSTDAVDGLLTIAGTAVDNVAVVEVTWVNSLGGSGIATGTANWTADITLLEGNNIITVTAYDAAGNSNADIHQETYSIPVDTEDPVIVINTPTSDTTYVTDQSLLTIAGTASDNVGVIEVTWENDTGGTGTATGTDTWTQDVPLIEGLNVLAVIAWDVAGNYGTDILNVMYTPAVVVTPDPDIIWTGDALRTNTTGQPGQYALIHFKMDLLWGNPNETTSWVWWNNVAEYNSWLNRQPLDNEFWMRVTVLSSEGDPQIIIQDCDTNIIGENVPFTLSTTGLRESAFAGIYSNILGTKTATIQVDICKDNGSGAPDEAWVSRDIFCSVTIIS